MGDGRKGGRGTQWDGKGEELAVGLASVQTAVRILGGGAIPGAGEPNVNGDACGAIPGEGKRGSAYWTDKPPSLATTPPKLGQGYWTPPTPGKKI